MTSTARCAGKRILVVLLGGILAGASVLPSAEAAELAAGEVAGDVVDREVDKLVMQGLELRKEKKNEEALELFRRAHRLRASARTFGHTGFALQQLRRWAEAEQDFISALAASDSSWLKEHRELLELQLEKVKRHVGDLVVIGPTGASVTVDGRMVGRLPLTRVVRVSEGVVSVRARGEGLEPYSKDVTVQGGGTTSLEIAMRRVELVPVSGQVAHGGIAGGDSIPSRAGEDAAAQSNSDSPAFFTARRIGGAAAVIGGLGVVGVGVWTYRGQECRTRGAGGFVNCLEWERPHATEGKVLGGLGAAAVVAGAILFFWPAQGGHELSVGVGPHTLSLGGTW
jgi:hypothetical protein